jgi:MFS family permease
MPSADAGFRLTDRALPRSATEDLRIIRKGPVESRSRFAREIGAESAFTAHSGSATVRSRELRDPQSRRLNRSMKKIETHRAHVPWSWVCWMTCPWIVSYLIDSLTVGGPLIFTMRKFITDPAQIGFLTSLKVGFNFVVGVAASYLSDRIWTRWGRRRPFLIAGWLGAAVVMVLFPFAKSAAALVPLIIAFQLAQAVAKPIEPLYNDVIPPAQRGRAATIHLVLQNLCGLFFFGVLVGQFDRSYRFFGFVDLSGERVLYWSVAAATFAIVVFLNFGVREIPPIAAASRQEFSVSRFLRGIFGQRQWWMVYLLYSAPLLAGVSTENFTALVRTDQLGFTKQELGWIVSTAMIVGTVVAIPISGILADRISRLRLFQVGIVAPALVNFVLFLFLRYGTNYAVSLGTLITFTLVAGAFQACLWTAWGPLTYDYIPSHLFGTVSAGLAFVGGIIPFLVLNVAGFWITAFTRWFGHASISGYDYSSIYVLNAIGAVGGLLVTIYFEREEKRGRVIAYSQMDPVRTASAVTDAG